MVRLHGCKKSTLFSAGPVALSESSVGESPIMVLMFSRLPDPLCLRMKGTPVPAWLLWGKPAVLNNSTGLYKLLFGQLAWQAGWYLFTPHYVACEFPRWRASLRNFNDVHAIALHLGFFLAFLITARSKTRFRDLRDSNPVLLACQADALPLC